MARQFHSAPSALAVAVSQHTTSHATASQLTAAVAARAVRVCGIALPFIDDLHSRSAPFVRCINRADARVFQRRRGAAGAAPHE
jgi:hypothetical protein